MTGAEAIKKLQAIVPDSNRAWPEYSELCNFLDDLDNKQPETYQALPFPIGAVVTLKLPAVIDCAKPDLLGQSASQVGIFTVSGYGDNGLVFIRYMHGGKLERDAVPAECLQLFPGLPEIR